MAAFGTYTKFEKLKFVLSNKYFSGSGFRWLRFLLFDHLSIGDITHSDYGHDLFNALEREGHITPSNVILLLEIAQFSELKGAAFFVQQYMRDNNVENKHDDKKRLSPYRKLLFKILRDVDPQVFEKILSVYQLNKYGFNNIWDAVLKLEIQEDLRDDPHKLEAFAGVLAPAGRHMLLPKGNNNDCSYNGGQPNEDITEDKYKEIIMEFAQWYDKQEFHRMLHVLFTDIIDDSDKLRTAKDTTDLLAILAHRGKLSRTNLSVLYNTVKVTEQLEIKTKIPLFENLENHQGTSSFSTHRKDIFKLGKLGTSDINSLDGRYNFPNLKQFTNNWTLILDLEERGFLNKENIEYVMKLLDKKKI